MFPNNNHLGEQQPFHSPEEAPDKPVGLWKLYKRFCGFCRCLQVYIHLTNYRLFHPRLINALLFLVLFQFGFYECVCALCVCFIPGSALVKMRPNFYGPNKLFIHTKNAELIIMHSCSKEQLHRN